MKIYLTLLALFYTHVVFAGLVVPNQDRAYKNLKTTATGNLWQERNAMGATLSYASYETTQDGEKSADGTLLNLLPYGMYSDPSVSVLGAVPYEFMEAKNTSSAFQDDKRNTFELIFMTGLKLDDDFGVAFGFSREHTTYQGAGFVGRYQDQAFEIGGNFRFPSKYYLGFGVQLYKRENDYASVLGPVTDPTLKYEKQFIGFGYQNYNLKTREGLGWEFGLSRYGRAKATSETNENVMGNAKTYHLGFLYANRAFEVSFNGESSKGETYFDEEGISDYLYNLKFEYEFLSKYYLSLGGTLEKKTLEFADAVTITEKSTYAFDLGYRVPKYDLGVTVMMSDHETATKETAFVNQYEDLKIICNYIQRL